MLRESPQPWKLHETPDHLCDAGACLCLRDEASAATGCGRHTKRGHSAHRDGASGRSNRAITKAPQSPSFITLTGSNNLKYANDAFRLKAVED